MPEVGDVLGLGAHVLAVEAEADPHSGEVLGRRRGGVVLHGGVVRGRHDWRRLEEATC